MRFTIYDLTTGKRSKRQELDSSDELNELMGSDRVLYTWNDIEVIGTYADNSTKTVFYTKVGSTFAKVARV